MAGFFFSKFMHFFAKTYEFLVITTESANLHQKTKTHGPKSF